MMLSVTLQQMREDRDAVTKLAKNVPVAVVHEGRTVAYLGLDSSPRVDVPERDEDHYTDNGGATGEEQKAALLASVNTSYWDD